MVVPLHQVWTQKIDVVEVRGGAGGHSLVFVLLYKCDQLTSTVLGCFSTIVFACRSNKLEEMNILFPQFFFFIQRQPKAQLQLTAASLRCLCCKPLKSMWVTPSGAVPEPGFLQLKMQFIRSSVDRCFFSTGIQSVDIQ